jgi:hypothetical protein
MSIEWLEHESATSAHRYAEAAVAMKEKALVRLDSHDTKMCRY